MDHFESNSQGMLALTLWPEWAFAIVHLGKRVENRTWKAPRQHWGKRFAIHAGAHVGGRPGKRARDEGIEALQETAFGLNFAIDLHRSSGSMEVAPMLTVGRVFQRPTDAPFQRLVEPITLSAVVATARLGGCYRHSQDPWSAEGQWQWLLQDVEVLAQPIKCVGNRGLWPLPDHVQAALGVAA